MVSLIIKVQLFVLLAVSISVLRFGIEQQTAALIVKDLQVVENQTLVEEILVVQSLSLFEQQQANRTFRLISDHVESRNLALQQEIEHISIKTDEKIIIVIVICGQRMLNQSINLIKSTVLFSSSDYLTFTVFTEPKHREYIANRTSSWPTDIRNRFRIEFLEPVYPSRYENWRGLFAQCATLRLFLPEIMNTTDSIIYLDADSLVLSDIVGLWRVFDKFDHKQLIACANETDTRVSNNWYQQNSVRFPFYGLSGLNSGILLMNLTRMREFKFIEKAVRVYEAYQHLLLLVDQDMLNILAYYNPEITYSLDCSWNFRTVHCGKKFICEEASRTGPKLLHGHRGLFDKRKISTRVFYDRGLESIYASFDDFKFTGSYVDLMINIERSIITAPKKFCSRHKRELIKPFLSFRYRLGNISI